MLKAADEEKVTNSELGLGWIWLHAGYGGEADLNRWPWYLENLD